jgi:hypothetical protein
VRSQFRHGTKAKTTVATAKKAVTPSDATIDHQQHIASNQQTAMRLDKTAGPYAGLTDI